MSSLKTVPDAVVAAGRPVGLPLVMPADPSAVAAVFAVHRAMQATRQATETAQWSAAAMHAEDALRLAEGAALPAWVTTELRARVQAARARVVASGPSADTLTAVQMVDRSHADA